MFILSPGLPKFIPDDMNFVREDTCAQVVFSGYKIPQYHVKNRLKAHNYYHPLKRVNTKETRNDEIWKQFERKSTDSMNKFYEDFQEQAGFEGFSQSCKIVYAVGCRKLLVPLGSL